MYLKLKGNWVLITQAFHRHRPLLSAVVALYGVIALVWLREFGIDPRRQGLVIVIAACLPAAMLIQGLAYLYQTRMRASLDEAVRQAKQGPLEIIYSGKADRDEVLQYLVRSLGLGVSEKRLQAILGSMLPAPESPLQIGAPSEVALYLAGEQERPAIFLAPRGTY